MLLWDIPFQDTLQVPTTFFGVAVTPRVAFLISAALMTACAQTQMVNRANPQANYYSDRMACEQAALAKYPDIVVPVNPSPPKYSTTCQRIGFQTECTTQQVDTSAVDRNAAQLQQNISNVGRVLARGVEVGDCMKLRGWVAERSN
jgi:hypothetical protein